MLHSLILPKSSPPRKFLPSRPAHPYLVKVLLISCLVSLSLACLPPVQAQGSDNEWGVVQCDAQGNSSDSTIYTVKEDATNTYPADMISAAYANPGSYYEQYLFAATPVLTQSPYTLSGTYYGDTFGVDLPASGAGASNCISNGSGYSGTYYVTDASGHQSHGPINGSQTVDMNGKIIAYFKARWQGQGPQPAYPNHLNFLVSTYLSASASVNYGSTLYTSDLSALAKVTDGDPFNETAVASAGDVSASATPGDLSGPSVVSGRHPVRAAVDPATGIAEVYLNATTHWDASNTIPYSDGGNPPQVNGPASASASSYISMGVQQDTRAVTITSTIDPTYHKDPATSQPVQNQPAHDGTINADSVQLGDVPGAAITYSANLAGSWAAGSSYNWYSASTAHSGAGTFTLPNDPPIGLDVPYGNNVNFANQEHINLTCVDAADGASGTGNYYVNWHNDFDDWITVVDTKDYGPTTRVTAVYHPLDDAKYSQDFEKTVKVDVKATGEGNLGSDKVGAKFGVELGGEYETSTKVTTEYTWVANKYNWIERQSFWHHREGTADNYGFHGYIGLLHWTLDSAYNPGTPLIDFNEYQRAEDAGPAY